MNAPISTYTGFPDKHNVPINIGDIVRSPDGFEGPVVNINCAIRYDINGNGACLDNVSSQLWSDNYRPWDFEVVGWSVNG